MSRPLPSRSIRLRTILNATYRPHLHVLVPNRTGAQYKPFVPAASTSLLRARGHDQRPCRQTQVQQIAQFHSTPRREGLPIVPLLAGLLKTSVSFEYIRMAGRLALTFLPVLLVKNRFSRKYLAHLIKEKPEAAEKKLYLENKIRKGTSFSRFLLAVPFCLLSLTVLASLERTPLSGRWRLILLSPSEEEEISKQLAGDGWYQAIAEILAQDGPTRIIPPSDWRYQWVLQTLRHLEQSIPLMCMDHYENETGWLERGADDAPLPPPPRFPLAPRPTAKQMLHWFCESTVSKPAHTSSPHTIPGPPYSLVIVDKPGCNNAFSFGFGPEGAGGIVVYSGFIDDVLSRLTPDGTEQKAVQAKETGFWSSLFGGLFPSAPAPPSQYTPTQEQTDQLAILLSHELAHLVLSHHLETLSSVKVLVPGTLSMFTDIIRALLFPVTMMFGPFVNDAVASLGKFGFNEVGKISEECTSMKQEFEADAVSIRILALSGHDARTAVQFWESRYSEEFAECSPQRQKDLQEVRELLPLQKLSGSTHPAHFHRVQKLLKELEEWERQKNLAIWELEEPGARHKRNIGVIMKAIQRLEYLNPL